MRLRIQIFLMAGLLTLVCHSAAGQGTRKPKASRPAQPGAAKTTAQTKSAPIQATNVTESVIVVTVRANAEVVGRAFTLGEIADIAGSGKSLVAQLAAIEVGVSPLPGLSRLLIPGDIIVRLRSNHLESKRVQVVAPPSIRVTRIGHDVAADEITQAAITAAQDALKDIPNATLEPIQGASKITVPGGKVQILAGAYRGQPERGTLYVPVSILVDGKPAQTVEVALKVHRKQTILVARRIIEPHTLITADDVALEPMDLPSGFAEPMNKIADALGKRAKRRILASAPVPASALETPPTITANDKVKIVYIFGAIRITATGMARQSGMVGETIRVYALETKKELDAEIVNARTVRIVETGDDEAEAARKPAAPTEAPSEE